ncbi:MAG: Type 1 glutamine amidotransferase-like domain-containing protein [Myxococcales bacterium]|nr:Type 1 glutamine amidotransferase-like domain-containing protein [Myxococcales bacterium]
MAVGILLGPQRLAPTVGDELENLGVSGPVATITAGWQEREAEDQELEQALKVKTHNLNLYARCEEVFREDRSLFREHRQKQDRLRHLQDLYRVRLEYTLGAARKLQEVRLPTDLVNLHFDSAILAIRALDEEHIRLTTEVRNEFEDRVQPWTRPHLAKQIREVLDILNNCNAIAISGGNVVTLLNRLRLFHIAAELRQKPILAWSAGSMALSDRIVLFHDHPPQGPGNAEVLDRGLGFFHNVVLLPHAKRRLNLDDKRRVLLFSRRFAPAACVAMNERCRIAFDGRRATAGADTLQLQQDGTLGPLEPSCL